MTPTDIHIRLARSLNDQVLHQLDLAGAIGHPGENGRAREQVVASFLRQLLPTEFGIDTGFVIGSTGGISNQIDLVIYRTGFYPVFEVSGIKHFVCESVAAVIENKSRLTFRKRARSVRSAFANLRSVKILDRTANRVNHVVLGGGVAGSRVVDLLPQSSLEVFAAAVTEKSVTQKTYMEELLQFCQNEDRSLWPNMYVAIRKFAGMLMQDEDGQIRPTMGSSRATLAATTKPSSEGGVPPLVDLAYQLVDHLRRAATIDFQAGLYFSFSKAIENVHYLPKKG